MVLLQAQGLTTVFTTYALAFQSDRVSSVQPLRQQVMASRIRLSVRCCMSVAYLRSGRTRLRSRVRKLGYKISNDRIAYVVATFIPQSNTLANAKGIIYRVVSYKCSSL